MENNDLIKGLIAEIGAITVEARANTKIMMAMLMTSDVHQLQVVREVLSAQKTPGVPAIDLESHAVSFALQLVEAAMQEGPRDPRELWEVIDGKKRKE